MDVTDDPIDVTELTETVASLGEVSENPSFLLYTAISEIATADQMNDSDPIKQYQQEHVVGMTIVSAVLYAHYFDVDVSEAVTDATIEVETLLSQMSE
jgi:hypothetical protein